MQPGKSQKLLAVPCVLSFLFLLQFLITEVVSDFSYKTPNFECYLSVEKMYSKLLFVYFQDFTNAK